MKNTTDITNWLWSSSASKSNALGSTFSEVEYLQYWLTKSRRWGICSKWRGFKLWHLKWGLLCRVLWGDFSAGAVQKDQGIALGHKTAESRRPRRGSKGAFSVWLEAMAVTTLGGVCGKWIKSIQTVQAGKKDESRGGQEQKGSFKVGTSRGFISLSLLEIRNGTFNDHLENVIDQNDSCFLTTEGVKYVKTVTATSSQYERDGKTLFASPTGRHPSSATNDKPSERWSFICHKTLPAAPFWICRRT